MKNNFLIAILLAFILLAAATPRAAAQTVSKVKTTIPFESLGLAEVKATGNKKSGMVEISMHFKNAYSKMAGVSLALGGFSDFGITDFKGHKYKVHTEENAVNINKGYLNIPFIEFGDKKFNWVAKVKQEIPAGETRKLTVRIKSTEGGTLVISDLHIRCILSLDYEHIGDKIYKVENIPVEWK